MGELTTCFVESAASNVSNPLDDIMIGIVQFWLEHFQVTHLKQEKQHKTRHSHVNMFEEEQTLKPDGANGTSKFIEIGGRVHFFFVSVSNNSISADSCVSFMPAIRLILKMRENVIFFIYFSPTSNALLPNDGIFRSLVLGLALQTDQLYAGSIQRRRNLHFDLLAQQRWFEIRFQHDLYNCNTKLVYIFFTARFLTWKKNTLTSILVRPTSRTNGITRKGNEMSLVVR